MKGDANDIARGYGVTGLRAAFDAAPNANPAGAKSPDGRQPSVLTSAEFVQGFVPPDYLIDGVLQRSYLYSLTGKTGDGKTAIALRFLASIALGKPLGGHDAPRGRVLMLVGENADDVRARWLGLSEEMEFDANTIIAHFIPGIFPIPVIASILKQIANELGDLALVIVDTGAAYFMGDEENSNTEMGDYARTLRTLTSLPGRPCVIVNCHPVKNASTDQLIPRGGGALIAEVDGNLCCKKTDNKVELHAHGKFRGPDFAPISFELFTVTSPRLVDSRGRLMPTVVARPLTDAKHAAKEDAARRGHEDVLLAMADHLGASLADLAEDLGWVGLSGVPNKARVHRAVRALEKEKLVSKALNKWSLTPTGQKAAKDLRK